MDLAWHELDSVSHGYFRYCFVFHLLLFGHYVCLELKLSSKRFSLSTMCHGIGCDFNKSDATVQAWHFGWNGFPSIALQSQSRTRQSVEIFTSVLSLDEHVILPVNRFYLMLCKILSPYLLNMFGFGSYHYEDRCFICMIGLFVCVAFIWMEWDF